MKTRSFRNRIVTHGGIVRFAARLLVGIFGLTILSGFVLAAELTTSLRAYGPNADIVVIFTGAPGNALDWIGVYREGAADGNYLTYKYLNGVQNGTVVFTAPEAVGNYNFRMFVNDGYTRLATSPSITVSYPADVDLAFGTDGWVKLDFLGTGMSDWISAVSVLKNGNILAAGTAKTGITAPNGSERNEIALARFTADGKLDATFGNGGKVHTDITNNYYISPLNYSRSSAMVVQPDGKIIVGGSTDNSFVLVRYTPDGLVDATFGYNGIVATNFRMPPDPITWDQLRCLVLQEDGKILAGGAEIYDAPYSPGRLCIARYNPDGSLDLSFNFTGLFVANYGIISGHLRYAVNSLAVQSDGHILAGITAVSQFGMNHLAIARYRPNAATATSDALDPTFGDDGIMWETRPGRVNDQQMTAIAVVPSGRILALGHNYWTLFVMRYGREGFIDSTFGTAGQTVSDPSPDGDIPAGMIPLPGENTLVGASFDTFYGLSVMGTFGLVRYNAAGEVDARFGKVRFPFMENNVKKQNQLVALAMQDTNKVILAGFTETGQQVWDFTMTRVILKPLTTGIELPAAEAQPTSFQLAQNFPNPFNPTTTIRFSLPERSRVTMKVYTVLGQEVTTLLDEMMEGGYRSVEFNAAGLPSGVYLYRFQAAGFVGTRKMVLIR